MSVNLLLFKKSNKNSLGRFFVMVVAIMLGVAIVLSYTAGVNALYQMAYRERVANAVALPGKMLTKTSAKDSLIVKQSVDYADTLAIWQNRSITIAKIARVDGKDNFLGMSVPKAGTFIASPELAKILKANPSLKNRLTSDKLVGTIPDKFLYAPDELVLFGGLSQKEISESAPNTLRNVASTDLVSYDEFNKSVSMSKIILVLIGSITLLIPVMLLIANASELGLAQREKRYAILKLVGATKRQVNSSIIFESLIASVIGIAAGSLLFLALRPVYQATIAIDNSRFFLSDISVQPLIYLVIVVITVVLCVLSDLFSLRKIKSSPLGIVKSEKVYKTPRFRSMIPLLLGIALLIVSGFVSKSWFYGHTSEFLILVVATFLLLMIGLLISGSYLTMLIGKVVSHFARRPVTFLATKRIAFLPKRTFRAVGGIVLALFVGCFYLSSVGSVKNFLATNSPGLWHRLNNQTAVVTFDNEEGEQPSGSISSDQINQIAQDLAEQSGVKNVEKITAGDSVILPTKDLDKYFTDAKSLKSTASFTAISSGDASKIKPVANTSQSSNAIILNFQSDGALEAVRDLIVKDTGGIANNSARVTDQSYMTVQASVSPALDELTELTYIAIAITIFVSALNIFISTVGGILERKSSFYNLWLCGLDVKRLRISLLIESVMPLILFSLVASVLGYIASKNVIAVLGSVGMIASIPVVYYAIVVGLISASVVGIWLISRQLRHAVDVNNNQTE